MTAPTDIPVNGDGTYDEPTWGEGGGPWSVPAYETNGIGDVVLDNNTLNYEWQHAARWIRAMAISRMVPSSAGLFGTFLFPGSGTWTTGGATLNSSITASWVMVDEADDGGVVVQFSVPVGSPHAFTASKDTYVSLNEAGDVEYVEVANGAGQPAATATYVQIWKVVTDGTEITAATVLVTAYPVFKTIGVESLGAAALMSSGDLDVTGNSDLLGDVNLGTGTGNKTVTVGTNASDTFTCNASATVGGDFTATAGETNLGVTNATQIEASTSIVSLGTLAVTSTSTLSGAVNLCTGAGNFACTIGSAASDTLTIAATINASASIAATDNAAYLLNVTNAGTGGGVKSIVSGGYAGSFQGDTTSPTHAALFILPQNADPSSPTTGDLYHHDTRGKIRIRTFAGWESVHSSSKGQIYGLGDSASGSVLSGASSDLSQATVVPEETGSVEVMVTGHLDWSADAASTTVQIRDDTANTTINGGGSGVIEYPIVGALGRDHSFCARIKYTLPSTASRTFEVRLTAAGGDTTYTDVTVSVRGVV